MFMNMFVTADFPTVTKPPVWLWICGDKETELKATQLADKTMFTANYVKKYATYEPAKFERLEDLPATNKSARAPVLVSTVAILLLPLLSHKFGCSARLELNLLCSATSARVELISYVLLCFSSTRAEVICVLSFQLDST